MKNSNYLFLIPYLGSAKRAENITSWQTVATLWAKIFSGWKTSLWEF